MQKIVTGYDSSGSIKEREAGRVTDRSSPKPGLCYKPRFYMKMDRLDEDVPSQASDKEDVAYAINETKWATGAGSGQASMNSVRGMQE